jgi:hypothetical protein
MDEVWLASLKTDTPQAGFDLAVKLAREGVKVAQPDDSVRSQLRAATDDSSQHMAASHVIAVHFQTIAAANNYWR